MLKKKKDLNGKSLPYLKKKNICCNMYKENKNFNLILEVTIQFNKIFIFINNSTTSLLSISFCFHLCIIYEYHNNYTTNLKMRNYPVKISVEYSNLEELT